MANKRLWILGAWDPEMEAIEALLRGCGEDDIYARDANGDRVHPGNAYRSEAHSVDLYEDTDVYLVECEPRLEGRLTECPPTGRICNVRRIDHHRSGDAGFGVAPQHFMLASSIGQVISHLGREGLLDHWSATEMSPSLFLRALQGYGLAYCTEQQRHAVLSGGQWRLIPRSLVLTAAADHCLGAAYRGECPGVDPDALMQWRAKSRARFQGRTVRALLADIEAAKAKVSGAPRLELAPNVSVRDMRGAAVRELPEAALQLGESYLAGPLNTPDGRRKYVVSGSSDVVEAFLNAWAANNDLTDTYGDPARGFAGGYTNEY